MPSGKNIIWKIVSTLILILFILIIFFTFISVNSKRIISQNSEYISDSANQKSNRVDVTLQDAQKNINILSYLYGQTLKKNTVSLAELRKMADSAPFDYIEFADKTGKSINEQGETTDVSNRDYFIKAVQGESGMDAIYRSQPDEKNLFVFSAPLRVKNKIAGVLMGFYREEQMAQVLDSSYFGTQAAAYLCNRNGQVIAGASRRTVPENILAFFEKNKQMSSQNLIDLKDALSMGTTCRLRYNGNAGPGIAYLTNIPNSDFMLFQSFPSEITQRMINRADSAGSVLTLELIFVLLLYIAVLVIMNNRQKRKILKDNAEMSFVIEGTTKLFDRFILVDLEEGIYRYLTGTHPDSLPIPSQGEYDQFVKYLASISIDDDEAERITETLTPDNIRRELGTGTTRLNYEYYLQRDQRHWESLNIVCLARRDEIPIQVLFTRQDVTEAKTNELRKNAALQDALHAATAANRAKSDFLSRMSHDIRTPMNAIMGMTTIASMNIDNPDKVQDCLDKITISNQHLLGLINEVLDMSKIESGKMILMEEEFNLSETIENLVTIFHPQIEKKKLHLDISDVSIKHERVIGDAQRLQQVFVNILGNAVKFTPDNGYITVTIKESPTRNRKNSLYEFVFADNGIGMENEFIDHLFEPFSQADDSRISHMEGNGLGMSIANNIIQMMNGHIRVKSTPGKGSQFTVSLYLRLCDDDDENLDDLIGVSALVVDDEAYVCENVCGILDSLQMKSDFAYDGDTALQKLLDAKEKNEDFSLVILDWKMPGKDGLEVAEEIREKISRDIFIIILSAYDWSAIEQKANSKGINAFITKPLFRSRLLYVLKNLLGKHQEEAAEAPPLIRDQYKGRRVLLVEDNELNMEIATELLQMLGFAIEKAYDGVAAINQVVQNEEYHYDLILMDIQMPNMNGYEATTAIRALDRTDVKTLPIIAMSANAFADDISEAKSSGMNDHIAKPIEIAKLTETIDLYL